MYILRVSDQSGVSLLYNFEGSQPEWCISSMIYSRDTPFWPGTLDVMLEIHHSGQELSICTFVVRIVKTFDSVFL